MKYFLNIKDSHQCYNDYNLREADYGYFKRQEVRGIDYLRHWIFLDVPDTSSCTLTLELINSPEMSIMNLPGG
jgi:hypothetical protein